MLDGAGPSQHISKFKDANELIIHSNELEPPISPMPHPFYVIRPHHQKVIQARTLFHTAITSYKLHSSTDMNTAGDVTPPLGPTQLAAGHAPPTPPHESALDDIYGSAPNSPSLDAQPTDRAHEMLSDLPSRQRALDADAYREGLASAKGQYVQEGFDEGYALGADIGLCVGYIFGVLRGLVGAWRDHNQDAYSEVSKLYEEAQKQLAIEQLLGQTWVDEEGIWKWEVKGADGDATFREVAAQHPVVKKWDDKVEELAKQWGVDLKAVDKMSAKEEEQS